MLIRHKREYYVIYLFIVLLTNVLQEITSLNLKRMLVGNPKTVLT
jgi:hypothetical protein